MQGRNLHKAYGLRIPDELKALAQEAAKQDRRSLNSFIVGLIENAVKKETNHANHA